MQNVTNTSTVAELLKQGAGEEKKPFIFCNASIAVLLFPQQRLPEHHVFLSAGPPANAQLCSTRFFSHLCFTPACNVLYLNSVETESLTGPEAVCKATKCTLALSPRPAATVVHFKVSAQGITLTDSKRRYMAGTTNVSLHVAADRAWKSDSLLRVH